MVVSTSVLRGYLPGREGSTYALNVGNAPKRQIPYDPLCEGGSGIME